MDFLVDIVSPTARKYIYAAVSLLALAYGVWQAAGGDWRAVVPSLLGSVVTALAHANTNPVDPQRFTPAPPKPATPDGTASGGPAS